MSPGQMVAPDANQFSLTGPRPTVLSSALADPKGVVPESMEQVKAPRRFLSTGVLACRRKVDKG